MNTTLPGPCHYPDSHMRILHGGWPAPPFPTTMPRLVAYLAEHRLDAPGYDDHPAFYGRHPVTTLQVPYALPQPFFAMRFYACERE